MIRGYTTEQIRAVERAHLAAGEPLMQRAADALTVELRALLGTEAAGRRILLLVGGGDNGGDALYAGAALAEAGAEVAIARTADAVHEAGLAAALATGARPVEGDADAVAARAGSADVVVDGILGIGASGPLRGRAREVVLAVADAAGHAFGSRGATSGIGPLVVAVDVPSGLDPDTGEVDAGSDGVRAVLPADVTVTMIGAKAGLLREPGRTLAGRIVVADLGLGADLDAMSPAAELD